MPRKTAKRAGNGKRRGGRRPVRFITHPDTDRPIVGLRFHKPSNRYYRIAGANKRVYYARKRLRGIEYQRRAIYEHECRQQGNEPNEAVALTVRHPAHDDFGTQITPVATFDDHGREAMSAKSARRISWPTSASNSAILRSVLDSPMRWAIRSC